MAEQYTFQSTLQLIFQEGMNPNTGEPMLTRKSFNNVKPEATADQLLTIASAFENLQQYPMYEINRRDNSEIRQS